MGTPSEHPIDLFAPDTPRDHPEDPDFVAADPSGAAEFREDFRRRMAAAAEAEKKAE